MVNKNLEELFKQAAEIAKVVPESMQEAAFHRALDALSKEQPSTDPGNKSTSQQPRKKAATGTAKSAESAESLVKVIDASKHGPALTGVSIRNRALLILQIAREEHEIDGLSPSDIATVLTEKFRIRTRAASVSDALGKCIADGYVNRIPSPSGGYLYQIMQPGEQFLAVPSSKTKNTSPPKKKAAATRKQRRKTESESALKKAPKRGESSVGRPGPKEILTLLIDDGFFNDKRTISDIIDHLREKRGRIYKATDLSPALTRLLREERLDRKRNNKGVYEYWKK